MPHITPLPVSLLIVATVNHAYRPEHFASIFFKEVEGALPDIACIIGEIFAKKKTLSIHTHKRRQYF
jgi:hypothetical protein